MKAKRPSAPASWRLSASPRTARPASSSASPTIWSRASMRWTWCAKAPKRSAARAAAAAPTWRRPAVPTAQRRTRRWRRSKLRSARKRPVTEVSRSLQLDDHAVFGRVERHFGAARQHVIAHVGEDQPLWPDLADVALERRQRHVRGDRLVARIGLADEQIGLAADID